MLSFTHCIWDFNGTILDDVETGIRSVNTMLAARGLRTISGKEEYRTLFHFPVIDYYRQLGFDFEREPYEKLAPEWVALYLRHVQTAQMFSDVVETLRWLRSQGVRQIILSATERNMLLGQVESLGIGEYFDEILGLCDIHAGSKLSLAVEWRKRNPNARAVFLGDTDHDVDTARVMDADCYLIAAGHQNAEHLRSTGAPVFLSLTDWKNSVLTQSDT